MSTPRIIFEGTGEEVSRFAKDHPRDRFQLTIVEGGPKAAGFDQAIWDAVMARIQSKKGKYPVLPDSAFSTDTLYD